MNMKLGWLIIVAGLVTGVHPAVAQDTAFTYQGQLTDDGSPADGSYSLRFILYNAEFGGSQVGPTLTNEPVAVANGLFTTTLDFGATVPDGWPRWLEVAVRTNGSAAVHQPLSPRQALTSVPYAFYAANAGTAMSVTGTVSSAVTFNNAANSFSGSFSGNGAGLTSLNASQLTSGTVPNARLLGSYGNALTFNNAGNSFVGEGRGLTGLSASQLTSGTVPDGRLGANVARTNQVWLLGGNAGTTAGKHFLGTTDGEPLELMVNNTPALRIEPNTNGAPNMIGGSPGNVVEPGVVGATIAGGGAATYFISRYGVIGGGFGNDILSQSSGFIGGGSINQLGGTSLGGSLGSPLSNTHNAVVGGAGNWIAEGASSSCIGGGRENFISQGVFFATVPGGRDNRADGDYSFAAGRNARAMHDGTFVWADSIAAAITSTASNQFIVRARGGVWFGTNNSPSVPAGRFINTSTGGFLSTGGAWTDSSDRNVKENFQPVDRKEILEHVARLPVATWNYKAEDPSVRHIGPVAQDFYAGFGVGQDDQHIAPLDANGVALAAIQGLNQKLAEELKRRDAENAELKARLTSLERLVNDLRPKGNQP